MLTALAAILWAAGLVLCGVMALSWLRVESPAASGTDPAVERSVGSARALISEVRALHKVELASSRTEGK